MSRESGKDLTSGSPFGLILGFALPMLLGLLFQQFYNMVDTMVVGQCLGVTSLAAVGSTGSINFMINGFCIGAATGFAIPVAQKFGAGDYKGMRKFVANAGYLAAVFAVVMTAAVGVLCMDILRWMNTPEDIIQGAYDYIFVIFMGIPVTYMYNLLAGIIRSLGDSKTPVYFLLLSSVLNIGLDFFTILVLHMGVGGPALATVVSQGISAVLCLAYMIHKFPVLRMEGDEKKPDRDMIRVLCAMGIPMGLQYSITAIGSVILQAAVNSLGSMAVAAVSTGSKISMFFCTPFDALGGTMATWAGQNVGGEKAGPGAGRRAEGQSYGLCLFGSGLCGAVLLRPVSGPAFRGFIGNGADPADLHLPDLQQYVLYSPDPGECGAVRHPGHGIQYLCHSGWGL